MVEVVEAFDQQIVSSVHIRIQARATSEKVARNRTLLCDLSLGINVGWFSVLSHGKRVTKAGQSDDLLPQLVFGEYVLDSVEEFGHARSTVRTITASAGAIVVFRVESGLKRFLDPLLAGGADLKEVRMPIITISRGSFSGGKMLAECVAQKLGYRCIDRDQIIQKATAWGVSQDDLRAAIEKPPTFLGQSAHTKYMYLAFIQAALSEEFRSGKGVYHGLAGHLLFGRGSRFLRVRIIAPMEFRINQVHGWQGCNRKEAIAYIEKVDQDRRKWTKFLYDVDWTDASLYDLVLNLEQMNLQEACEVVCCASQLKCFALTPDCQRAMDDLALASCVKANLAREQATANFEFEVVAESGAVSVKGDIISPGQAKLIGDIVHGVPGVASVELRQLKLAVHI